MLRKCAFVLGCIGYGQVSSMDSVPSYEVEPVLLEERSRVTPIYRLDPRQSLAPSFLQAAFEQVPGAYWMGTSAHGGRPVLRGLSYQRILLLYNHLPRDGDYWGEDHGYEVPARYFFLVPEVVLGPQAVRYGSGALGGVVHYRPFLLDSTTFFWQWQGLQNPAGGSAQIGYLRRMRRGGIAAEGGFQRLANYLEPVRGAVWNTALQEGHGGLLTEAAWGSHTLRLWAYVFSQRLGLPPEDWDPEARTWLLDNGHTIPARAAHSLRIDAPYQYIQNLTTGAEVSRLHKEAISTFRLSYLQNQRQEYGYGAEAPDVWLRNRRLGAEWVYLHPKYQGGITSVWSYRTDGGSEPFAPTALSWESGLWGRYRYPTLRGQWQIGLRLHYGGHYRLPSPAQRHYFAWATEISYEAPTYQLKFARSFRLPHPVELWANGFHEGARRYEIGNPTLPTEIAYTLDSRLAYRSLTFQSYLMYFPQYIFFERTQDTLVSAIGAAFQYVTKPALLTGLETTYERDWLTLTLSYVHGQFLKEHADSLRAMPKVPPLRLRLQVLRAERAFQPYLETALYAPQRRAYTAYRTEIPTPGYVLVNGGLRLRRHAWMLTLGVTNLLNARYQSHLSIFRQWGREGICAPGRSFYVRMEGHL